MAGAQPFFEGRAHWQEHITAGAAGDYDLAPARAGFRVIVNSIYLQHFNPIGSGSGTTGRFNDGAGRDIDFSIPEPGGGNLADNSAVICMTNINYVGGIGQPFRLTIDALGDQVHAWAEGFYLAAETPVSPP